MATVSNGKDFDFKALERQLKEVLNNGKMESSTRQEVEKALQMLPRYKQIDELVEGIRKELTNAMDFNIHYEIGHDKLNHGYVNTFIPTGRKTITIEVIG